MRTLEALLDLAFPPRCDLCGARRAPARSTCSTCRLGEDRDVPRCHRCARRLPPAAVDGTPERACADCRRGNGVRLDRTVCVGDYAADLRELVLRFKHAPAPSLAEPLGRALARALLDAAGDPAPVLVPIPLHAARRFERGFDQADRLALAIEEAGVGQRVRALRRRRASPPQGSPFAAPRAANVRDVFALRRGFAARLAGRAVWLIDDVGTTLSTAEAAALAVRRAGPASCGLALVARADRGRGPPRLEAGDRALGLA